MFKKILSAAIIVCFFLTSLGPLPQAHADSVLNLPAPGTMINLSPAYQPVMIKGLTVHKDNPFLFDFIVDVGQDKMSGEPLKKEGEKLIKYFLASLAIPDKDLWVNLSPYEKNRIIPEVLGQTDMGRDLLEQDYILKQVTASLIYPEKNLGKKFWDRVYAKSREVYGSTQIPVNTFNKVWITADRAEVLEHNQTAFVVDSHLKVMLEEDYLALKKHTFVRNNTDSIGANIVREIVLPELEREVNTGKNFANVRQIFNAVILSSWYKKNLKEALLNQVYSNKSRVKGINLNDPNVKEEIYQQYLRAYKKGVFNYIKEDINTANGTTIPRKYFSGGVAPGKATTPLVEQIRRHLGQFSRAFRPGIALVTMFAGLAFSSVSAVAHNPLPVASVVRQSSDVAMRASINASSELLTDHPVEFLFSQGAVVSLSFSLTPSQDHKESLYLSIKNEKLLIVSKELQVRETDPVVSPPGVYPMYLGSEKVAQITWDGHQVVLQKILGFTEQVFVSRSVFFPEHLVAAEPKVFARQGETVERTTLGTQFRNDGRVRLLVGKSNVIFSRDVIGDKPAIRVKVKSGEGVTAHEQVNIRVDDRDASMTSTARSIIGIATVFSVFVVAAYSGKMANNVPQAAPAVSHRAATDGGIDLNTSNMFWKVNKDGKGVEMIVDPDMIERIRHIDIDSLSPIIFKITPATNIWLLAGLQAPL